MARLLEHPEHLLETAAPASPTPTVPAQTPAAGPRRSDPSAWLEAVGRLRMWMSVVIGLLTAMGFVAAALASSGAKSTASQLVVRLFDLNVEANIPSWWAGVTLFCASGLLAWIAHRCRTRARPFWRQWTALAAAFAFLSLDEIAQLHDLTGEALHQALATTGALRFAWVIPYGLVTVVFGLWCLPFLRQLPAATRRLFVFAGLLYVGGALGFELLEGLWSTYRGWGRGMRALTVIEECLEMLGVMVFIQALLQWIGTELAGADTEPDFDEAWHRNA